jgi:hypothetical protein
MGFGGTAGLNTYVYTTTTYLPDDALGPWYWSICARRLDACVPSETRTSWVAPAPEATPTQTQTQ